jgi:hypothetical protein
MADNKPNKGALFKNERASKESDPGYKGSINVDGREYWLNAWVNTAKSSGQKYFALSVSPKDSAPPQPQAPRPKIEPSDLDF